jgi:HK97 gp10 family phage protein
MNDGFTGMDDFKRHVGALIHATSGDTLANAVQPGAAVLLGGMQERVAVDTGELRDSLRIEITTHGDSADAFIETDSDHAAPVEFGTHTMPARSYIRRTVDIDGSKAIDAIAAALGRQIEGAV